MTSPRADSSPGTFDEALTAAACRLQRARRGAIIGGALGVVAAAVGLTLLLGTSDEGITPADVLTLVLTALGTGCITAALGHLVAGGRTAPLLSAELGYDTGGDRIKRAIAGQPQSLDEVEQLRASRYAALGAIVLPAQFLRFTLLIAGVASAQTGNLISTLSEQRDGPSIGFAVTGLLSAVLLVGMIPAYRLSSRRYRAYAVAHPVTAGPSEATGPETSSAR